MKFNEHLSSHLTPEWRTQYIKYSMLKEFLYKCVQDEPVTDLLNHSTAADNRNSDEWNADDEKLELKTSYYVDCDASFFPLCSQELKTVNNFFTEKLAEAVRKFDNLRQELLAYQTQLAWKQDIKKAADLNSYGVQEIFIGSKEEMEIKKRAAISLQRKQGLVAHWITEKKFKTLHDLKLGFSEFYLSLILLQNFQNLNFTGFRKILKKHDKLFGLRTGLIWRQDFVDQSVFHVNAEVDHLILKVESTYIDELESGDRQKAMKRLRVPPLMEKQNSWTTFRLGLFMGIFFVQLAIIGLTAILSYDRLPRVCGPAIRIFRSTFLLILFLFLIGINVYGWRTSGVNHVLIFEIDPRNHLTPNSFMEKACRLFVMWGCCVIYFIYSPRMNSASYIGPFVIVLFLVVYVLNPIRICHYKSRLWFRTVMVKIILAPLYSVHFAHFWIADQLNSLSFVFVDVGYFICFYGLNIEWSKGLRTSADLVSSTDEYLFNKQMYYNSSYVSTISNNVCNTQWYGISPLLRCLPAWFRFAQCMRRYYDNLPKSKRLFPHVVNAGKYLSGIFVVLTSVFYVLHNDSKFALAMFLLVCIINSVYTCSWDLLMDWGLFDRNAQDNKLLRDELVYRYKVYYYVAIVENIMGRLMWVITIVLQRSSYELREIFLFCVMFIEVFRRFVWNFFRLENEHLNNCGEFRAVRDIFIAPVKGSRNGDQKTVFTKKPPISATEGFPLNNDSDSETHEINGNDTDVDINLQISSKKKDKSKRKKSKDSVFVV